MRFESLVGVTIIKCLSDLLKTEQQKIRLGLAGGGVGEGWGGGGGQAVYMFLQLHVLRNSIKAAH